MKYLAGAMLRKEWKRNGADFRSDALMERNGLTLW
jgi:hypothetical protein